jgi:hypothetical protein
MKLQEELLLARPVPRLSLPDNDWRDLIRTVDKRYSSVFPHYLSELFKLCIISQKENSVCSDFRRLLGWDGLRLNTVFKHKIRPKFKGVESKNENMNLLILSNFLNRHNGIQG